MFYKNRTSSSHLFIFSFMPSPESLSITIVVRGDTSPSFSTVTTASKKPPPPSPPPSTDSSTISPAEKDETTTNEKESEPDKSKTEIVCDRYLRRFQIWDPEKFEYVPYDPSENTHDSDTTPKKEDEANYFYIDTRVTIGDDFFSAKPEYLVTSFFPKLSSMRKKLATALSFALSDKAHTRDECLQIMKSVGINNMYEDEVDDDDEDEDDEAEDCSTSESDIIQQVQELVKHVEVLMNFLEGEFKPTADRVALARSYGHAEFDLLQYFFEPGQEVVTTDDFGKQIAFIIEKTYYDSTFSGRYFNVEGYGWHWDGSSYSREDTGTQEVSSLPVTDLKHEVKAELKARGRLYTALSGVHYKVYKTKRVIVDRRAFENRSGYTRDPDACIPELEESRLHLLPSEVYGFNLGTKKWSHFLIEELTEVVFDEHAWDHLVLDEDIKTLIKGLVKVTENKNSSSKMIGDVISGKGGGLISVLHGPPGTGKTLTAESVAELLRRPLYMVGSSELSSESSALERNLRSTLSLATAWDAVLLIDEADVFLEQRSLHELERNALVSVALRVLEYHRDVLFLTTNRIKTFDEAFLSRFSIAIKYPELDATSRQVIWQKFFSLADCVISPKDLEGLAAKSFNGRTIKNMVRTAQALALSSDKPLGIEHVRVVVRAQEKFLDEFSRLER
ncbi:P-loop containing nucleoside triphosphate hydrolase protein [Armillaria fumosa]|nr:P-loop containing nucleoside triphosphate hydrolase protein [Armillaria fumosa]